VLFQSDTLYPWAGAITADQKVIDLVKSGHVEEAMETPVAGEAVTANEENPHSNRVLDPLTLEKRITGLHWLNPYFFVARCIVYFLIWIGMARWYYNQSLLQDTTGDVEITRKLQKWAGLCTVVFGLTLTGAAGDMLMSLDPHWFSTMWAVYYFAGSVLVIFSVLILLVALLQQFGYLRETINVEHYHDLGKYLFAFTFFWGYIAFSQFMLLWYANIPEEVAWFSRHGATTAPEHVTGWSYLILAILFGQLLIPFGGLMSRHVKRTKGLLVFWALWQLSFHLLDTFWIVMPEYPGKFGVLAVGSAFLAYIGIGGLLLAVLVRGLIGQNLRVAADPRLPESLAFHNI
jgi:hypothetical protein